MLSLLLKFCSHIIYDTYFLFPSVSTWSSTLSSAGCQLLDISFYNRPLITSARSSYIHYETTALPRLSVYFVNGRPTLHLLIYATWRCQGLHSGAVQHLRPYLYLYSFLLRISQLEKLYIITHQDLHLLKIFFFSFNHFEDQAASKRNNKMKLRKHQELKNHINRTCSSCACSLREGSWYTGRQFASIVCGTTTLGRSSDQNGLTSILKSNNWPSVYFI